MNLLNNLQKEDIQSYPFPHITKEDVLPSDLAGTLLKEYPPLELITKGGKKENERYHFFAKEALPLVTPLWESFILSHLTQSYWDKFAELFNLPKLKVGIRGIDTFKNADVLLEVDVSVNTPTSRATSVRTAHTDDPHQILTGLYYLRDDDSEGGDLELYKWNRKPLFHEKQFVERSMVDFVKPFPYKHNSLILFPNTINALHGVSPRQPTKNYRYLVALAADVKEPLFIQPQESRYMRSFHYRAPLAYKIMRKLV